MNSVPENRASIFEADYFFGTAGVEDSARPALLRTDTLLAPALATTGLTDIYDVRASLNPWYWSRSAD
jgi:hypothetical protein